MNACPSWCNGHHLADAHRRWYPGDPSLPLTGIIQVENYPPRFNVGPVAVELGQAEPMAVLMEQLGRKDVAAAIRQLMQDYQTFTESVDSGGNSG